MGLISLQTPVVGLPNGTEDVKVVNDFTILQTLVNGNLDTNNLNASAGITAAQLAPGAGRLFYSPTVVSVAAADGALVVANAGALTVSLPGPTVNALVGVLAGAGVGPTSVVQVAATGGAHINGIGLFVATGLQLGRFGSFVLLQCDGANWWVIAGQQDSGWSPLTLAGGTPDVGAYVPAARRLGDIVYLRGAFTNSAVIGAGGTLATVPSGMAPSARASLRLQLGTGAFYDSLVTTGGVIQWSSFHGSAGGGEDISFDGQFYPLS